ncbi:MAG: hypothetical protein QOI73_984 [Solirubrobacteraceae bacterium]|nr:hypothetical protein [Solirubrobacteraceae bacterium]
MPDEPTEPAAGVRNVGAVAFLSPEQPDDPDFATVGLRLFATTSAGERVLDPQPASTSLRIERSKLAGLELSVQMSLRLRAAPSGARLQAWERIAGELAAQGIEADPVALHGLGFALVLDDELKAEQAASARG